MSNASEDRDGERMTGVTREDGPEEILEDSGENSGEEFEDVGDDLGQQLTAEQEQLLLEEDSDEVFAEDAQMRQREDSQESKIKTLEREVKELKEKLVGNKMDQFEQELRAELAKAETRRAVAAEELRTAKKKLLMLEHAAEAREEDVRRMCQSQANSFSRCDQGRRCDPRDWRKGQFQPRSASTMHRGDNH